MLRTSEPTGFRDVGTKAMSEYTSRGLETLATTVALPTQHVTTNRLTEEFYKEIPLVLSTLSGNSHTTNQIADGEQ